MFWGLFPHPFQNQLIAVCAIKQAAIDPADRRGACAGDGFDLVVGLFRREELRHLKALGNCLEFLDGADILKETIAFLFIFQKQYCLKQIIGFDVFQLGLIAHGILPIARYMQVVTL